MGHIDALRERITQLFAEEMSLEVPSVDTNLFDTGALDSLGFVQLLALLEQEFGFTTSLDDLEENNFKSIAQIAELVATRTNEAPRAGLPGEPQGREVRSPAKA
jgi:acyl carrier protein